MRLSQPYGFLLTTAILAAFPACGARTGLLDSSLATPGADAGADAPAESVREARADAGADADASIACGSGPGRELDAWLAFDALVDGNRDIYVIRPGGCDLRRLTTGRSVDREPTFSPDGRFLAYVSTLGTAPGPAGLVLRDLRSGETTSIATSGMAVEPSFSRDGQRIAFRGHDGLYSINIDGSDERREISGPEGPTGYAHPVYAPDGASLFADRGTSIVQIPPGAAPPVVVLGSGTDIVETPSVGLDGTILVYSAVCEPRLESIWLSPLRGGSVDPCKATRISPVRDSYSRRPAAGPGNLVAYERGLAFTDITLVAIGAGAGAPFNVTQSGKDNRNPAWSPIGTIIP